MTDPFQPFDAPRRAPYQRPSEELHIPSSNTSANSSASRTAPYQHLPGPGNLVSLPPSINIHQPHYASQHVPFTSGPETHYPSSTGIPNSNAMAFSTLPGPLQPGRQIALPQISTSLQPPYAHGHSKSTSTGSGYAPQTPYDTPFSPLGLAEIRQDMAMMDDPPEPPQPHQSHSSEFQSPKNSNYNAPWPIYALDWCKWPVLPGSHAGRVAIGSYVEDNHNYIQVLNTKFPHIDLDLPESERGLDFVKVAEASHAYPVTRILWEPASSQKQSTDLLATSGDHLRLWSLPTDHHNPYNTNTIGRSNSVRGHATQKLSPLALLSNSKSPEHTAPITSLDWNAVSPSLIITSSIDTTCTIWDIPTLTAKTQLIAHDKEVFDVRFCANSVDLFVSCGADGSVRMFDLRSLEHSTIIYEPSDKTEKPSTGGGSPPANTIWPPPLQRIAASPHDAHLLATFSQDSNVIRILDVRQPGQALLDLKGHSGSVNCIEWCPSRRGTIVSGADDCQVLIWDLMNQNNSATILPSPSTHHHHHGPQNITPMEHGPAAVWICDYEVSNVSWAPHSMNHFGMSTAKDWLGVCGGKGLWAVSL